MQKRTYFAEFHFKKSQRNKNAMVEQLARQAKLRREFIRGKMLEHKEKAKVEKKKQVKKALEENKMLPTTVQEDALKIQDSLEWDDVPESKLFLCIYIYFIMYVISY
ncbi:UNVERIFIED_CONTAM: hypothetical protein NCL1_56860 [Trichonephila clavipes]